MLDLEFIQNTLIRTASGIPETFQLVLVSLVISTPLAFFMAVVNLKPNRFLSKVFRIYISFVRSVPAIIIIFFIYHSLPLLIAWILKLMHSDFNIYDLDNMVYGYIVFTFMSIPQLSEVFRSGLLSISGSQMEAAGSIGMTPFQAYVHIIVPQVVDAQLPVLCTFVTNLIKMTSLAFGMSIREITGEARVAAADSIRYIECYLVIFIMYLILCLLVEQLFKYFERHSKLRRLTC